MKDVGDKSAAIREFARLTKDRAVEIQAARPRQIRAGKIRQTDVTKLEANQTQATSDVVARARPGSSDFAKLVTWVSRGAIRPGANDFAMLRLLSGHFCRWSVGWCRCWRKGVRSFRSRNSPTRLVAGICARR